MSHTVLRRDFPFAEALKERVTAASVAPGAALLLVYLVYDYLNQELVELDQQTIVVAHAPNRVFIKCCHRLLVVLTDRHLRITESHG